MEIETLHRMLGEELSVELGAGVSISTRNGAPTSPLACGLQADTTHVHFSQ